MTAEEIQAEITEKKQLLVQSDYETTKSVEHFLLKAKNASTTDDILEAIREAITDFAPLFEERQSWRDRINCLQTAEPDPAEV